MNRMITLIWALGVMFCAVPAYASGGFNDKAAVSGTQNEGEARSAERSRTRHHAKTHGRTTRYARGDRRSTRKYASGRSRQSASARRGRTTVAAHHRRQQPEGIASLFSALQTGIASHYWEPQKLASGGWFNPRAMTAAHKTLPFGTKVRVTNVRNGKSVDVTINDRGPYVGGRIIDLSSGAAGVIGMKEAGVAKVQVQVLGR